MGLCTVSSVRSPPQSTLVLLINFPFIAFPPSKPEGAQQLYPPLVFVDYYHRGRRFDF